MEQNTITVLLDYIWVPVVTGIGLLWHRINGMSTRTALLEQAEEHHRVQRIEDREVQEKRFSMIMKKLDGLEVRIKNGH